MDFENYYKLNGITIIKEILDARKDTAGDICIPVYVGGTLLDEVVVSAQTQQNLRSGGR